MRTTPSIEIALRGDVDRLGAAGLAAELRTQIDRGEIRAGQRLPSTRAWSRRLGVARTTVVSAFEQLIGEGYLVSRTGSGTRVNPALGKVHPPQRSAAASSGSVPSPPGGAYALSGVDGSAERAPARTQAPIDLTLDRPPADALSTTRWRSAWRTAAGRPPGDLPAAGSPALRQAISDHLARMRDVVRDPAEIFVTAGAREGLTLLRVAAWGMGGRVRIGVEQPGYPTMRRALRRLGCETVPVPVDAEGIRTDLLRRPAGGGLGHDPTPGALDGLLVTPSHQYPFGSSLRRERRSDLIAWATTAGGLIIEDDYDSELRYAGRPLPALCTLDDPADGVVVTLGTFSKTIAADVGVGFLIAPRRMAPELLAVRRALGVPVPAVAQSALAEYLRSGELERHTARMRRLYGARRELVSRILAPVSGVRVLPMDGGLHVVAEMAGVDEQLLLARCAAQGVRISGLSAYWAGPADRTGFVVGCAQPDAERFEDGLRRVARVCAEVAHG